MSARIRRMRSEGRGLSLNMTPLIDVVFLLLIYFTMIASMGQPERSIEVRLSGAEAQETTPFALPEHPVQIRVASVDAQRYDLRVEGPGLADVATFDALADMLIEASQTTLDPDQRFVVDSTGATSWAHSIGVVEAIRRAGFSRITLSHGEV